MSQGVRGSMILDQKNFNASSCARQAPRINEFFDAGGDISIFRPRGGSGFACMHVKTFIFDKKVIMTGSCNFSHGGF